MLLFETVFHQFLCKKKFRIDLSNLNYARNVTSL